MSFSSREFSLQMCFLLNLSLVSVVILNKSLTSQPSLALGEVMLVPLSQPAGGAVPRSRLQPCLCSVGVKRVVLLMIDLGSYSKVASSPGVHPPSCPCALVSRTGPHLLPCLGNGDELVLSRAGNATWSVCLVHQLRP